VALSSYVSKTTDTTFTFDTSVKYVGFWWMMGSNGNNVQFLDTAGNEVAALNVNDVITFLGSNTLVTNADTRTVARVDSGTHPTRHYYRSPGAYTGTLVSPVMDYDTLTYANEPWVYLNLFVSGSIDVKKVRFTGNNFEIDNLTVSSSSQVARSDMVLVESNLVESDAGGGSSSGGVAVVGEPELPAEPQIALGFRGRAGQPSEGAVVDVSGLSVPAGSLATVSLFAPEVKLFEEVSTGGAFDRAVALPAGLAPGSYTVVYQVLLPSGEVLALNVVIEIGDGGVITSVSENLVGSGPAGAPGAMTELSYTGVRSSSLPWWAIITIFGGLMLILYSRRAVKMAEAFDARLDENGYRTPWEILSTPIRVPGIDYSPASMDAAGSSQSLGEAIRGLDVALSLILASQIARLRTHA
jgi:hypothetical protein